LESTLETENSVHRPRELVVPTGADRLRILEINS
jgi:hypothetical protein